MNKPFLYLTGFTGFKGFFSFSQFPDETEKEASRYSGEITLSCCVYMICHTAQRLFDHGAFICCLWRHGVFVLPPGKDKRRENLLSIPFILSNMVGKSHYIFFHI